MGRRVTNGSPIPDIATGEYCFEIHRRIPLSKAVFDQLNMIFSKLVAPFEAKIIDEAKQLLSANAPENAQALIEVFFEGLKAQKHHVKDE